MYYVISGANDILSMQSLSVVSFGQFRSDLDYAQYHTYTMATG